MMYLGKNRFRGDSCVCGFRRVLYLPRGVSIFHKNKCPKCKRVLKVHIVNTPSGELIVHEEKAL
jgi:phage FluMu protein Com